MCKKQISATLEASTFDFLNDIAEINNITRSNAIDLVTEITRDYLSNDQISSECAVRGITDGRRAK